jgi:hypothetical protein
MPRQRRDTRRPFRRLGRPATFATGRRGDGMEMYFFSLIAELLGILFSAFGEDRKPENDS